MVKRIFPPKEQRRSKSALPDHQTVPQILLHARWLPLLLLCALAVALLWRSVALGEVFLPLDLVPHLQPWRFSYERVPVNNTVNSDVVLQVYPRRVVTNALVRQGAWPLWNSTILTGTPLLADGQMIFFYPPSLLFLLLPLARAFGYYALLQVILAGTGSYLFARQLKLGQGAATLVGLCYMFSGYLLTWLQFPHHTGAAAMLPWCFWAVARACAHRRLSDWLLAGGILAMPLLTHIQVAFYTYVGVGCYVLVEIMAAPRWRMRARLALGFAAALALALALSAAQLLPQIALSAEGQRAEQAVEVASPENQFAALLRLVLPSLNGKARVPPPAWGPAVLQLPQPYAGLAPLILAVLALLLSRHRSSTLFGLLALGAFALAVSSPLLQVFLALVPPYRQFGDHTRWFALWGFAAAVLAGLGAEALLKRDSPPSPRERRTLLLNRLLLGLTALFVAIWAWRYLALFTSKSRYGAYITQIRQQSLSVPVLIGMVTLLAVAALMMRRLPRTLRWGFLLAVVAGDLLWYGGSYNTSTPGNIFKPTADLLAGLPAGTLRTPASQPLYPLTRQLAFLQQQPRPFRVVAGDYPVLPPNLASAFGIEDVRGYQSLYLARYNRLVRMIDGNDYTRLAGEGTTSYKPYLTSAWRRRRLLDMLNVEFILFPPGSKNVPLYAPLERVQTNDEGAIYRNPRVLPRAWLVHRTEVIPEDKAQLDRLARPDFDPAALVVLPGAVAPVARPADPEPVPVVDYTPNHVRVRADVKAPAVLVVSDAYADGWQVAVDGRPAPLLRANYALRGVWLPRGIHEVTFTYRPRSFLIGGMISGVTLLILLLYALGAGLRDGGAARLMLPRPRSAPAKETSVPK